MKRRIAVGIAAMLGLGVAGCVGKGVGSPAPRGAAAYAVIPEKADGIQEGAIQPGDRLAIRVMGEVDLSSENYWVDGNGLVQMPLVGELKAGGQSTSELRRDIASQLGQHYLRDPQVSISIIEHAKQSVTVEGEVQAAGRFEASPNLTLLGALALAHSTTRVAKLGDIMVFRQLNGQNLMARFNLMDIRAGRAADPQIVAGDRIVVSRSTGRSAWQDFLQAAPMLNVFYLLSLRIN